MENKYLKLLMLVIVLSVIAFFGCTQTDDGPSDSIIKFTFHPDCPSVKIMVYIDNKYTDLIYSDGEYQYHVEPGTHSYIIKRASDDAVIWSGQVTVPKGTIQDVILTCTKV